MVRVRTITSIVWAVVVGAGVLVNPVGGQTMTGAVEGGRIVVSAVGEVTVTPDKARVQLGVETRARTAALAAQENARKQTAVLKAIQGVGVKATQITTMGYGVNPVQRWDDKLQRTVIEGYQVHNLVSVETEVLEQVGGIIDGALAAGANRVAGLDYVVKDAGEAEDRALAMGVERARRQAKVVAKAAGGVVGGMVEVQVNPEERGERPPMVMARMAMDSAEGAPTPVSAGTQVVRVRVMTRWRFEAR
jgi:uncharacterized protein YggE